MRLLSVPGPAVHGAAPEIARVPDVSLVPDDDDTAFPVLDPSQLPSGPYVEVSARQVFDVQWSFAGKELTALEFNRPSGTGPKGGFFRPVVDQDNDYYRLLVADSKEGQFQLRQYDCTGALKHQLTTYGQIKAISKDVILYSGDAQYGTLITLRQRYSYGSSAKFSGLTLAPAKEHVLEVFERLRAERFRGRQGESPSSSPRKGSMQATPNEDVRPLNLSEDSSRRRATFNTRVSTFFVRNLCEIPAERKADFWWTQDDFAEFLKVRVQLGKVYRQAAKQMGVDILKVSSEGSLREEGYVEMVKLFPELAQESRRGLGLGRKKERARNRDAYIAGVLKEQSRQRALWERSLKKASMVRFGGQGAAADAEAEGDDAESCQERKFSDDSSDSSESSSGRPRGASEASTAPTTPSGSCANLFGSTSAQSFALDVEAMKEVAMKISRKDREYAHFLAKVYYEQDRMELGFGVDGSEEEVEGNALSRVSSANDFESLEDFMSPDSPRVVAIPSIRRKASEDFAGGAQEHEEDDALKDEDEEDTGLARKEATLSKGFGLSREKLREVGLSATGHSISRSAQRASKFSDGSASSDGESDAESGASDWEEA